MSCSQVICTELQMTDGLKCDPGVFATLKKPESSCIGVSIWSWNFIYTQNERRILGKDNGPFSTVEITLFKSLPTSPSHEFRFTCTVILWSQTRFYNHGSKLQRRLLCLIGCSHWAWGQAWLGKSLPWGTVGQVQELLLWNILGAKQEVEHECSTDEGHIS